MPALSQTSPGSLLERRALNRLLETRIRREVADAVLGIKRRIDRRSLLRRLRMLQKRPSVSNTVLVIALNEFRERGINLEAA